MYAMKRADKIETPLLPPNTPQPRRPQTTNGIHARSVIPTIKVAENSCDSARNGKAVSCLITDIKEINSASSSEQINSVCNEIDDFVSRKVQNGRTKVTTTTLISLISACIGANNAIIGSKVSNILAALQSSDSSTNSENNKSQAVVVNNNLTKIFNELLKNRPPVYNLLSTLNSVFDNNVVLVQRFLWEMLFKTGNEYFFSILEASDTRYYFQSVSDLEKANWLADIIALFKLFEQNDQNVVVVSEERFKLFFEKSFGSYLIETSKDCKCQLAAINQWIAFLLAESNNNNTKSVQFRHWALGVTLQLVEFEMNWNFIIEAVIANGNLEKLIDLALEQSTDERFRAILHSFLFEELCPFNPDWFRPFLRKMIKACKQQQSVSSSSSDSLWYAIRCLYPFFSFEIEMEFEFFFESTCSLTSYNNSYQNLDLLSMFADRNPTLFRKQQIEALHACLGKVVMYSELLKLFQILEKLSFENARHFQTLYCQEYYSIMKSYSECSFNDFNLINTILRNIACCDASDAENVFEIMEMRIREEKKRQFTENVIECWKYVAVNYPNLIRKRHALLDKLMKEEPILRKSISELLAVLPAVTAAEKKKNHSKFCILL